MAMVDVVSYLPTGGPVAQVCWLGPEGRQSLGAVLHSSCELCELLQWFCHDKCTMKPVLGTTTTAAAAAPTTTNHHHRHHYY